MINDKDKALHIVYISNRNSNTICRQSTRAKTDKATLYNKGLFFYDP